MSLTGLYFIILFHHIECGVIRYAITEKTPVASLEENVDDVLMNSKQESSMEAGANDDDDDDDDHVISDSQNTQSGIIGVFLPLSKLKSVGDSNELKSGKRSVFEDVFQSLDSILSESRFMAENCPPDSVSTDLCCQQTSRVSINGVDLNICHGGTITIVNSEFSTDPEETKRLNVQSM